jgi:hypothetical protein
MRVRSASRRMARWVSGIVALNAVLGAGAAMAAPAAGAWQCASPTVTVTPTGAAPGEVVLVQGRGFVAGCEEHPLDAGSTFRRAAQSEIELWMRVGDARPRQLAEVHLDDRTSFAIAVQLPADLETGPGVIEVPVDDSLGGVVSVPLEVAGSRVVEGDAATWTLSDGIDEGGVPWRWVGVGAVGGALALLVLASVPRRADARRERYRDLENWHW